jgi:DNA topoisomerase-1
VLKELGDHPAAGGAITLRSGRYGPYVNHGKTNATIPRTMKPEDVTLEQAVELIAERESRAPSAKTARGGRSAKSTARKAPAKKPAAKKPRKAKPKTAAAAE